MAVLADYFSHRATEELNAALTAESAATRAVHRRAAALLLALRTAAERRAASDR